MSKERELLERAIDEWDSDRDLYEFHKVMEEIRVYLAEPEVKREALSDEYLKIHIWRRSEDYGLGFVAGVRFAEKHHGIGGGDE